MTNDQHLQKNIPANVKVNSSDLYSGSPQLMVKQGEVYSFHVRAGQTWKDACKTSGPEGYFNPLLWIAKPRLQGVPCFCLCGTIDKNENGHFRIGAKLVGYQIPKAGFLYFFANDNTRYYYNNSGYIFVQVTRIK